MMCRVLTTHVARWTCRHILACVDMGLCMLVCIESACIGVAGLGWLGVRRGECRWVCVLDLRIDVAHISFGGMRQWPTDAQPPIAHTHAIVLNVGAQAMSGSMGLAEVIGEAILTDPS